MKNNKGVTLIVLVVTIVVLMILAGVTLNLTIRNNGIINQAKETVNALKNEEEVSQTQIDTYYNRIVTRTTYQ